MSSASLLVLVTAVTIAPPVAETLEAIRKEHDVPAMAAAVVNADGLIESAAVGVRKKGTDDPVAIEHRFALGSCTKSFTGTLIECLIEDGVLDGDDRLGEIFSGGLDGASRRSAVHAGMRGAKVDELLAHTSGMVGDPGQTPAWAALFNDKRSPRVVRRELVAAVLAQPPASERGTFAYSNLGYVTLAVIAEEATGKSYEELVRERILEPLQMDSAIFRTNETAKTSDVWGHDEDGKPQNPTSFFAENPTAYSPVGTLHVAVDDWAKWAQWHLAGDPAPILKTQAAFDRLHVPLTGPKMAAGQSGPYGHGWILPEVPSGVAYTHGGSNTAFFSLVWVVPGQNVAAVVLTNQGDGFPACNAAAAQLMQQFAE